MVIWFNGDFFIVYSGGSSGAAELSDSSKSQPPVFQLSLPQSPTAASTATAKSAYAFCDVFNFYVFVNARVWCTCAISVLVNKIAHVYVLARLHFFFNYKFYKFFCMCMHMCTY